LRQLTVIWKFYVVPVLPGKSSGRRGISGPNSKQRGADGPVKVLNGCAVPGLSIGALKVNIGCPENI
jgi:hypothetical protein